MLSSLSGLRKVVGYGGQAVLLKGAAAATAERWRYASWHYRASLCLRLKGALGSGWHRSWWLACTLMGSDLTLH